MYFYDSPAGLLKSRQIYRKIMQICGYYVKLAINLNETDATNIVLQISVVPRVWSGFWGSFENCKKSLEVCVNFSKNFKILCDPMASEKNSVKYENNNFTVYASVDVICKNYWAIKRETRREKEQVGCIRMHFKGFIDVWKQSCSIHHKDKMRVFQFSAWTKQKQLHPPLQSIVSSLAGW